MLSSHGLDTQNNGNSVTMEESERLQQERNASAERYYSFKHWKTNSEIAHFKTSLLDSCHQISRSAKIIEDAFNFYGQINPQLTEEQITDQMRHEVGNLFRAINHINEHKEWYDRNNNPISI